MRKEYGLAASVLILISIIAFRIIFPYQPFFDFSIYSKIIDSLLIISGALVLSQIINLFVRDRTIKKIAGYVIVISTAIMIFFFYQDQLIVAGISLGITAIILTFIFQNPLLSFVGWVYLVTGKVYKEGDRIRIGEIKGDVVSIGITYTKILEISGEYILSDLPSGRVITFPNSLLLTKAVSNYTEGYPYIWTDIGFQLTYETDFDFLKPRIEKVIRKYLKGNIKKMREAYEKETRRFGNVRKFSEVNFSLIPRESWIELRVTFPVDPSEQSKITTAVIEDILKIFNKHPRKAKFPIGRRR